MRMILIYLFSCLFTFNSCVQKKKIDNTESSNKEPIPVAITLKDIKTKKDLLYDQYTLADKYSYLKTKRAFQWDKIRKSLFLIDSIQVNPASWAILKNYRNVNGTAPYVKGYRTNKYGNTTDTFDIERSQASPLFLPQDITTPERYARDGMLVRYIKDSSNFVKVSTIAFKGEWMVPKKYVKPLSDTLMFRKTIFIDRKNQNIATLEKGDSLWLVRSMNPATTGLYKPPYKHETPAGIFVIQGKIPEMLFLKDGSKDEIGGFAPYASRFSGGAYVHGIPVDKPRTEQIEYSSTLGTKPRSHMCVRNATSHAKFVYDWATSERTIVFIFD